MRCKVTRGGVKSDTSNHHPHLALHHVRPTLFNINVDICPFWALNKYLEDTETCWRILTSPILTGNWCLGGWLYRLHLLACHLFCFGNPAFTPLFRAQLARSSSRLQHFTAPPYNDPCKASKLTAKQLTRSLLLGRAPFLNYRLKFNRPDAGLVLPDINKLSPYGLTE